MIKQKSRYVLKSIIIEDLEFTYASFETPAIRNINLEIEEGEFVILTGLSGCGKTTLCRCINGLIPHFYRRGKFKGRVIVDGFLTREYPMYQLTQKVGLVFQDPENQLMSINVERELAFGPENLGLPRDEIKERIQEVTKVVGLQDILDKPPHQLSGGEQQKVAIGAILAMKPKILVLDEPTSNLDPMGALKIITLLRDLNENLGITILLIEHRLDMVLMFADRVLLMHDGEIILNEAPKRFFEYDFPAEIGIGYPKLAILFDNLKKDGLKVEKIPLTSEEAVNIILRAIS